MEKEIWKDVVDYEGLYQISNFGRLKTKQRSIKRGLGIIIFNSKILKPRITNSGYYAIVLTKNKKRKLCYIHRLVAITFLPNNNNLEQVNHIDGNKQNNILNNLEWCSRSDNVKHAIKNNLISYNSLVERAKKARMAQRIRFRVVAQIKNGEVIKTYNSTIQAGKQFSKNADRNISACARGEIKSAFGFQWKYI